MSESPMPIAYMERTRNYYRALGYSKDYVWSHYEDVPFARLSKPLAATRVGLVTTAKPLDLSNEDNKGIRKVWSAAVDPPPDKLNTDKLAWDRDSTHTDDRESFLPIVAMQSLIRDGRVGGLTARFHGVPTEYSQRKTIEVDAPNIHRRLVEDGADAALLSAL